MFQKSHSIFSIHDAKAKTFHTPFFAKTHGEAERNFVDAVNDERTTLNKYPQDFNLYHVGDYDDQSGIIRPLPLPEAILQAIAVHKPRATTLESLQRSVQEPVM